MSKIKIIGSWLRNARLALAAVVAFAAGGAWADAITAINPVTGAEETYTYKFTGASGTGTWDDVNNWVDSSDGHPTKSVGISSGTFEPYLFNTAVEVSPSGTVEGWALRLGAYNGAQLDIGKLVKIQGGVDMWVSVDATSKVTINDWGKGALGQSGHKVDYSIANAGGLTFDCDMTEANNQGLAINYYLTGNGSVSYQKLTVGNHYIMQADAVMENPSQPVRVKKEAPLVSFATTSTSSFSTTASTKVLLKDSLGATLITTTFTAATLPTEVTITANDAVGTCQLVREEDGVYLYYIDGSVVNYSSGTVKMSELNALAPLYVSLANEVTLDIDAQPASNLAIKNFSMVDNVVNSSGFMLALSEGGTARMSISETATKFKSIGDGASLIITGLNDNTGTVEVSLPAGTNADKISVKVVRTDGGYCVGTWNGGNSYTYNNTLANIYGTATLIDLTYTNSINYACNAAQATANPNNQKTYAKLDLEPATYNNNFADKTTGLYLKHTPWMNIPNATISANSAAMSVAVVGTMSPTPNTIFLSIGSCNNSYVGILFCSGATKDTVDIYSNTGTTLTLLTSMSVPNAATARHVYIVTKEDDGTSSTFNVWLDGTLWKSYNDGTKYNFTNGGIQVGSDHGGKIHELPDGNANKRYKVANNDNETGYINVIRYYGKVLTEAEIKAFSSNEEYPYTSPNGNSKRTFSADGSWVTDGTDWETTTAAGVVSNVGAPLDGSALTVTGDGGTAQAPTEIAVNLDSTMTYEAINISGDPVAFDLAEGKTGTIRVTGAVEVGTAVKIKKGALSIEGPITFLQGGSVDFDYSEYDASGITTETQIILATGLNNTDGITCSVPQTPFKTYNAAYNSGTKDYILTITPQVATIDSTGYTSFSTALQETQSGDTIQINQDVTVDELALDKNVTIKLGAEYTTGTETPFTLTVGSITGEGALTLAGTGTLKVPVGTTIPNLTSSGSAKIAVTGTVAKGTTLFTITSGTYANERVGTDTYGDVHYTATDGAYVVGKTYYWKNSSTNNSTSGSPNNYLNNRTASWSTESPTGTTASDIPLAYDTAIFNKSGARAMVGSSLPCNIKILADFSFLDKDKNTEHILGADDLTIEIADGATMYLAVEAASFSNVIKPKGKLIGGETARVVASPAAGNSSIKFAWDASEYKGSIDIRIGSERNTQALFETDGSLDNSFARWYVSTNGTYSFRSGYTGRTTFSKHDFSKIYKFGSLQAYLSCDDKNGTDTYRLAFELGKNVDEDSWLRNKWYKKTADHGGKIFWWAPTATFTNEIVNSYQVDLCGGGNVYIPASATENAAAEYVPTQLNFTDNGGYLLFNDDNDDIATSIIGAINTVSAPVGFNVTAANTVSAAAPSALLSGKSFNKKGSGSLTLTGAFTSLGTVSVSGGILTIESTSALTDYSCGAGTYASVSGTTYTFSNTYTGNQDVGVDTGNGTVTVTSTWISENELATAATASETTVPELLAPSSTVKASNGYNYFTNYALNLDPDTSTSVPTVGITTDASGNFVLDLEGCGTIPEGVTITLSVLSTTDLSVDFTEKTEDVTPSEDTGKAKTFTIAPSTVSNVEFFKIAIGISGM